MKVNDVFFKYELFQKDCPTCTVSSLQFKITQRVHKLFQTGQMTNITDATNQT